MFDLRNILLALGAGLLIGSGFASCAVSKYKTNQFEAKMSAQKASAAMELNRIKDENLSAYQVELAKRDEVERNGNELQKKVDALSVENRRLVAARGGLYDRPDSGRGSTSASSTQSVSASQPASAPACEGRLSDSATEFLLQMTKRADDLAVYAQRCYEWVNREE